MDAAYAGNGFFHSSLASDTERRSRLTTVPAKAFYQERVRGVPSGSSSATSTPASHDYGTEHILSTAPTSLKSASPDIVPFSEAQLESLNRALQAMTPRSDMSYTPELRARNTPPIEDEHAIARPPLAARRDSNFHLNGHSHEDVTTGTQPAVRGGGVQSRQLPPDANEGGPHAKNIEKFDLLPRYDPEDELLNLGKRDIGRQKIVFIAGILAANGALLFAIWWWPKYYYVFLPIISITLILNCLMIFSIILITLKNLVFPEKFEKPSTPETLAFVIPCYNETYDECVRSLDSLVNQTDIDEHRRGIIIICDGRVRGPGMEKTTAQYLLEDILVERDSREYIKAAYMAWDHQDMDVEIQRGKYKGVPYICIIKQQNQGKRDGLIVVRSFLYNFNLRNEQRKTIFSKRFFGAMASFLVDDAGIDNVTHLIGMDADTVFEPPCVSELLKQSRDPKTVGVCGNVCVDFSGSKWSMWGMYQSAEYSISQGLRRLHQSIATKKVSCLPGCCQLLRICDATCSDKVLIELFGYCPKPNDSLLRKIRSTASEDRNHVCLMLTTFPKAKTRQALRARAYTDVPRSWPVFLSQRRRWTLGATSNDLMLITAPGVQWFERILALSNVTTWCLNFFILGCLAGLIKACMTVEWWIILSFATIMIIPAIYYVCLVFWMPKTWIDKVRYLIGFTCYVVCGPFLNIIVLTYSIFNVDSFGWGKTRRVVSQDDDEKVQGADEESQLANTEVKGPSSLRDEIVAVIGSPEDPHTLFLVERFSTLYPIILYNTNAIDDQKHQDSLLPSTVEVTTDVERLALARIFIISQPGPIPDMDRFIDLVSYGKETNRAVVIEGSAQRVGACRKVFQQSRLHGLTCAFTPRLAPLKGGGKLIGLMGSNEMVGVVEILYKSVFPEIMIVQSLEVAEMLGALGNNGETMHAEV